MQFSEFLGQVQHLAKLPTTGHALAATRATLVTLGERLAGGEPKDLASQLPREIGHFLIEGSPMSLGTGQRFGLDEFCERVAMREGVDLEQAGLHARAVLQVVKDAVSPGEMAQVSGQLPADLRQLLAEAGHIPPEMHEVGSADHGKLHVYRNS